MTFEWDEQKRSANLAKHGIAFEDIVGVFDGNAPLLVQIDDRMEYGEMRWIGIGVTRGHVVAVVFTEPGPDRIRLISARKANGHEREQFFITYGN